ncbi:15603_t:CDS:1, partial [Gigaspora rosea]
FILWEISSCRKPFGSKAPLEIIMLTQNGERETASEMLLEYEIFTKDIGTKILRNDPRQILFLKY